MGKYYAVANGRSTGIYDNWDACKSQVNGYSGAQFKSFSSRQEALAFMNSNQGSARAGGSHAGSSSRSSGYSSTYSGGSSGSSGRGYSGAGDTGGGYAGGGYASRAGAGGGDRAYAGRSSGMSSSGSYVGESSRRYLGGGYPGNSAPSGRSRAVVATSSGGARRSASTRSSAENENGHTGGDSDTKRLKTAASGDHQIVYTDGSALGNGKRGSRAGWGTYWGPNDARNASGKVTEGEQTNNRGELNAISTAVKQIHKETARGTKSSYEIRADSQYARDALGKWGNNWENNGWKTSSGADVKNRDIIEPTRQHLDQLRRSGVDVTISYIPGHAGHEGNEAADRLARDAAGRD